MERLGRGTLRSAAAILSEGKFNWTASWAKLPATRIYTATATTASPSRTTVSIKSRALRNSFRPGRESCHSAWTSRPKMSSVAFLARAMGRYILRRTLEIVARSGPQFWEPNRRNPPGSTRKGPTQPRSAPTSTMTATLTASSAGMAVARQVQRKPASSTGKINAEAATARGPSSSSAVTAACLAPCPGRPATSSSARHSTPVSVFLSRSASTWTRMATLIA